MQKYLDLLKGVLDWGDTIEGRNGNTIEYFGISTEYDLAEGFPLITTKKMAVKSIIGELLGFIRGYDNTKDFEALGCSVWSANAKAPYWLESAFMKEFQPIEGCLGRIYGVQWRKWLDPYGIQVDQLYDLIEGIKREPHGRRHLVTAYNPGELDKMCLPPCHMFFQVNISKDGKLNLRMYQRSADMFLGVPFNIASYAFLMLILCHQTGYEPGRFIHDLGSAHIYENHLDQVQEQLSRVPYKSPKIYIDPELSSDCALEDYEPHHFIIENYEHDEAIKAEMSV